MTLPQGTRAAPTVDPTDPTRAGQRHGVREHVGQRWRLSAEGWAELLEAAPPAGVRRGGRPLAGLTIGLDRPPEGLDEPFGGEQVRLVGGIADQLAVGEVDQLEEPGDHPAGAPDDERVEPHLEQRLALEPFGGRAAGLVVDDADGAVRRHVHPVDVPAEHQARVEQRLHVELPLRRLEAAWVLQCEVAAQALPARRQPRSDPPVAGEHQRGLGLRLEDDLPRPLHHRLRLLRGALRGGKVEEVLEHLVHHGAAHGLRRGSLREPVDGPQAVHQRTGAEVGRPAGREGAAHPGGQGRCLPCLLHHRPARVHGVTVGRPTDNGAGQPAR